MNLGQQFFLFVLLYKTYYYLNIIVASYQDKEEKFNLLLFIQIKKKLRNKIK